MSSKDVVVKTLDADHPTGKSLFIGNCLGTNGKFFDLDDTVADLLEWLENVEDTPEMNPALADPDSQAYRDGMKTAHLSIQGNFTKSNPYDKRWNYSLWNNWSVGHYRGMK